MSIQKCEYSPHHVTKEMPEYLCETNPLNFIVPKVDSIKGANAMVH